MRLIGYCLEDEHRLLVYEFMPRGSLENHLFRSKLLFLSHLFPWFLTSEGVCLTLAISLKFETGGSYFQPLPWSLRLKVALDAAKGLAFLHSAENKVIYRDFKTSNILLDSVCRLLVFYFQSLIKEIGLITVRDYSENMVETHFLI